ncbi:MAG: hypothetical protein M3Z54_03210 [Gemmatimonadota bacterium]|nr:hypothetical protein [Gemmatimonadota bacterium]
MDSSARSAWSFRGLPSQDVTELISFGDSLYAGTTDGVYRAALSGNATLWIVAGLQGKTIRALVALSYDTLLAAVAISGVASDTVSMFRTTNGGASWMPYQNGFGGREPTGRQVRALARLSCQPRTLLATGNAVVAKSTNGGASWRVVWGDWASYGPGTHFVETVPGRPDVVWAGGESASAQAFLVVSTNQAEGWRSVSPVMGDNAAYSAAMDPTNPAIVYVGVEGRVLKTTDGGRAWAAILSHTGYPYFYGVAISGSRPATVYAAGAINTGLPQGLILYRSDDGGASWSESVEGTMQRGGIRDLLLWSDGRTDRLFLATADGVYEYMATADGVYEYMP